MDPGNKQVCSSSRIGQASELKLVSYVIDVRGAQKYEKYKGKSQLHLQYQAINLSKIKATALKVIMQRL